MHRCWLTSSLSSAPQNYSWQNGTNTRARHYCHIAWKHKRSTVPLILVRATEPPSMTSAAAPLGIPCCRQQRPILLYFGLSHHLPCCPAPIRASFDRCLLAGLLLGSVYIPVDIPNRWDVAHLHPRQPTVAWTRLCFVHVHDYGTANTIAC